MIEHALSIKQPWGYCITDLPEETAKRVENRTWNLWSNMMDQTIAIHVSKKVAKEDIPIASLNAGTDLGKIKFVTGSIIGVATIIGLIYPSETTGTGSAIRWGKTSLPRPEKENLKRWFVGPYGFILGDVIKLPEPIPASGSRGFWKLFLDDKLKIEKQLSTMQAVKNVVKPPEKVRPFSNGTEFMTWVGRNCEKCKKVYNEETETYNCKIDEAISHASIGDGLIEKSISDRAGGFSQSCKEFEKRPPPKPYQGAKPQNYGDYKVDESKIKFVTVDGKKRVQF